MASSKQGARSADAASGFTLIELMVVVVIIAILAAVAYPAYISYVVRTNQSAAQQFLMEVGNRQEQAMLDKRQYESSLSDLNMSPSSRVNDYYSISVSADNSKTPPTYTITATPDSSSMQSGEPTLKLNSDGTREPADEWQ